MKIKIKDCKSWVENNNVYMELTYNIDAQYGSYEFTIPKIQIQFRDNPELEFPDMTLSLEYIIEQANSKIGNFFLPKKLRRVNLNKQFIGFVESDKSGNLFYLKPVKNNKYKMTKEEIEKELGYMIEIVK